MNYHGRIMNIPINHPKAMTSENYKEGHRDARHDAAEIANEADAEIERLRSALGASEAYAKECETAAARAALMAIKGAASEAAVTL
jgi:catalase